MADVAAAARRRWPRARNGGIVLVGRRQLRSNNSWMHNLPNLVGGTNRCTLHVAPADAERIGLTDGGSAPVRSRAGEVVADVEVTDAVMEGVVSLPHGWGHGQPGHADGGRRRRTRASTPTCWPTSSAVDPLSGNAVLNGIPVELGAGLRTGQRPVAARTRVEELREPAASAWPLTRCCPKLSPPVRCGAEDEVHLVVTPCGRRALDLDVAASGHGRARDARLALRRSICDDRCRRR